MATGGVPVMEVMGIAVQKSWRLNSKLSAQKKFTKTQEYEEESASEEVLDHGLDTPWALSPFAQQLTILISTVTLVVGESETHFYVSENILCKIPFFQAALQGNFREASEKLVKMPDDDPELVSKMVEMLMRGDYSPPVVASSDDLPTIECNLQCNLFHAQVYLLGEKYAFDLLCDKAGSYLRSLRLDDDQKLFEYMVLIYEMTSPESSLRLLRPKSPHAWAWDVTRTRHLVARMWKEDGGSISAHRQDGSLGEVCKRCPELARDLLALVCGGK